MLNSLIRRRFDISENLWPFKIPVFIILLISVAGCSGMQNVVMRDMDKIQFGVASYYGKEFHGNRTSCGEEYDMHALTAAHRVLPFGTLVKVTNVKNGRTAIVKINDRGPWKLSRVIDLSYAAAEKLGMINDGVVRVRLDVIDESLAMNPWDGQEFQGRLTADDGIHLKNHPVAIQLYSPFESPLRNANPENGRSVLIPKLGGGKISLSDQVAGNLEF